MLSKCKLNNKSMRNTRREAGYQAIVIDLAMLGKITEAEAEMLLGGGVPSGLTLPDGSNALTATEEPEEDDTGNGSEEPEDDA